MDLSKRKTLAVIGGGFIAAAGIGATAFVTSRRPQIALAPWGKAGNYEDVRKKALSYAILAPNPHNPQPWMVDLVDPDTVIFYRDPDRALPHTDPFSRQITIGLGCFLEQMKIAATLTGHQVELDLFPEGEQGPVAVARFKKGAQIDPLAAQIMDRRSCKEPFEMVPIESGKVTELANYATIISDGKTVDQIRRLSWDGWMIEAETPRTLKESVDLMRLGKAEINANPDGIDLGGPMLETLMLMGVLTREANLDPDSQASRSAIAIYSEMLAATPAYAVLTSATNDRVSQIETGAAWLRLNLKTTELGLSLHPISQALQEYPEMAEINTQMHALLAGDGETVQMLGRLGYGPVVGRTPRWPLEAKLVNG